ncbi:hypothetical protein BpHYR1_002778 [Brachionus plicatilis]|uniref:Uncharacterized protein n=1 Tax=Brachionus plicatilis TaxID=10195 RepID=A0A3M7SZJ5_BRAPC|nr:hypothetical protein BpHYR1_002778 [Brachionus plicatilis]
MLNFENLAFDKLLKACPIIIISIPGRTKNKKNLKNKLLLKDKTSSVISRFDRFENIFIALISITINYLHLLRKKWFSIVTIQLASFKLIQTNLI